MTDGELIAALAKAGIGSDLLVAVASRMRRKAPKEVVPTDEETAIFERLWAVRQQFVRRPGDPKKRALIKFVQQIRAKPATFEEVEFGIRCEYGAKKDRPELYAQMETFMSQRRWDTYDYAAYAKALAAKSANVVNINRPQPITRSKFGLEWDRQRAAKQAAE